MTQPYLFDEFFASNMEESISPFITKKSRWWGKNIALKNALMGALFLLISFSLSFYHSMIGYLFLSFAYFHVGIPALIDTIEDLKHLNINIDVLMTLAAFMSIVIGSGYEGALLLVLFEVSGAMETAVTHKARSALHHLHRLAPKRAFIVEGDEILEKSVNEVRVGTKILVKAGEIVPLDGKVIHGASSVNLVHLTGESLPVLKEKEMEVPAGAQNLESALTIEVMRTSSDSTLSKIIELVTKASNAKPKLQRFLDKFSRRYAVTIIGLTCIFALFLPFIFNIEYFGLEGSIYRALTFMIAASPCALIIATPTAYLSAISSCARNGVLLKGGVILDALSRCHVVSFDKTGTLTKGELEIDSFEAIHSKLDAKTALSIAYGLEKHVVHPISKAISKYAETQKISPMEIENFSSIAGHGLQGKVKLKDKLVDVYIGFDEFIQSKLDKKMEVQKEKGKLLSLLLIDGELFKFHFTDSPRDNVSSMLQSLKERGLKTLMLTGDHLESANSIAASIGIDEVHADLRPEDKLRLVEELSEKAGLAMVGDGVNDAPALARSSVGISMGRVGSAAAVDASDVVFLRDEIHLLDWLFKKAQSTMRIVKENLILALVVILFATTPALLGLVPLWLAVVLHEGGTVLVGLNSLRLLKRS